MSNFCELTRAYSLPMSVSAFFAALCASFAAISSFFFLPSGLFWINAILLLFAVSALHLAGNLFDDYKDVLSYVKRGVNPNDINFKNNMKARLILNGTYKFSDVKKILLMLVAPCFAIGLYFIWLRGLPIIGFMLAAFLLGIFYPKSTKFGLQEVTIGLLFGPLLVNAVYYCLTGYFDFRIYNFSMVIGILTSILLLAHSIMDYEYDSAVGKKTLPVLLKNKNSAINLILILILLAIGITVYTKLHYEMNPIFYVPVLFIIPVAVKLISSMHEYIEVKDVKFQPKWYWGNMENWNEIKDSGAAYFMFRFYLARNLGMIFNITLAICLLIAFDPAWDMLFRSVKTLYSSFGF